MMEIHRSHRILRPSAPPPPLCVAQRASTRRARETVASIQMSAWTWATLLAREPETSFIDESVRVAVADIFRPRVLALAFIVSSSLLPSLPEKAEGRLSDCPGPGPTYVGIVRGARASYKKRGRLVPWWRARRGSRRRWSKT